MLLLLVCSSSGAPGRPSTAGPRSSRRASRPAGSRPSAAALGASVWLGLFAFKHVDYSRELWWQFEVQGEASRFLRASVGAAVVLLLVGVARLIGHAPHEAPSRPTPTSTQAATAIATQTSTISRPGLPPGQGGAVQRDRTGVRDVRRPGPHVGGAGRSGGPDDRLRPDPPFLERCDDFGGVPVFYEIGQGPPASVCGLRPDVRQARRGGEGRPAHVHARGRAAAKYRQAIRRLEKDGGVVPRRRAGGRPALMDQLRAVSDDWLAQKAARRRGSRSGSSTRRTSRASRWPSSSARGASWPSQHLAGPQAWSCRST